MALIQCPECGKEISDAADNCPNCGYPIKQFKGKLKKKSRKIFICAVSVVAVVGIGIAIGGMLIAKNLSGDKMEDGKMQTTEQKGSITSVVGTWILEKTKYSYLTRTDYTDEWYMVFSDDGRFYESDPMGTYLIGHWEDKENRVIVTLDKEGDGNSAVYEKDGDTLVVDLENEQGELVTAYWKWKNSDTAIPETYTKAEKKAAIAMKGLLDILLDPSSIQVHHVYAGTWIGDRSEYLIKLDISAKTKIGGVNRKEYYVKVKGDDTLEKYSFDDDMMPIFEIEWNDSDAVELDKDKVLKLAQQ